MGKEQTLIEYATFYGSIQIIQYSQYNNVSLTSSLWSYTVHSNNPELIHFLEEKQIKPQDDNEQDASYENVYEESIRCHNNAFADYIKDNFLDQTQTDNIESCIL